METNSNKRNYTARNTTKLGVRTVLFNNVPVGRGKPKKDAIGNLTVVYVPKGEKYDATKHGVGVKFDKNVHKVTMRIPVATA